MLRRRLLLVVLAGLLVTGCAAGASSDTEIAPDRRDSRVPTVRGSELVPPLHPSVDHYPDATLRLVGPSGRTVTVEAKIANTPSRRRHGLMEVPVLPDGAGMLFVFPSEQRGGLLWSNGFWMKNTLIPLDIAFVGQDGSVNRILRMEPCTSMLCPVYEPGIPYRHALEVPAGWFERVGVEMYWRLELPEDLPPAS